MKRYNVDYTIMHTVTNQCTDRLFYASFTARSIEHVLEQFYKTFPEKKDATIVRKVLAIYPLDSKVVEQINKHVKLVLNKDT